MKLYLISLLFFTQILFGQSVIKQITDFDFNSRNPVFITTVPNILSPDEDLIFEGQKDSAVNIYLLEYNAEADSFYQLKHISSNNYINNNPVEKRLYNYEQNIGYKILLWETNQNGSWDIAYSIDSNGVWTENRLLLDSSEDEHDPSFITYGWNTYFYQNPFQLVFSRGNSIFLFTKDSVMKEELVFRGNDTINYSNPALCLYDSLYAVAVKTINRGDPFLVYKTKKEGDTSWSESKELYKRAPSRSPKFMVVNNYLVLLFEVLFDGNQKILIKNLEDFGTNNPLTELMDDQSLATSDFNTFTYPIITKRSDFNSFFPYSFRYVRNDSAFIRTGPDYNSYENYEDFYTKIYNSKSSLGFVAFSNGLITYTVWEDSSKNGNINLFGIKKINPSGDVNNRFKKETGFRLFQNYPNPFNPVTKIRYQILNPGFVSLRVYDILGKEIKTIVNDEKKAGLYEADFDASKFNLSSGIYFYRLKAGSFAQTKKFILMK